jgi:hypothetical protein
MEPMAPALDMPLLMGIFSLAPLQLTGCRFVDMIKRLLLALHLFGLAFSVFVKGRLNRLKVVFLDKTELSGRVVAVEHTFCLMRTSFHSGYEPIVLLEDEQGLGKPQHTFIFVPHSDTCNEELDSYAMVESLESYFQVTRNS